MERIVTDRKQLKAHYRQNPPEMGVYQIKNKINGKILIGSALNLAGKLNSHKFQLKLHVHKNRELQNDYDEYGSDNFEFEVLDLLEPTGETDQDYSRDLAMLEEMWLDKLMPFGDRGYHKTKT